MCFYHDDCYWVCEVEEIRGVRGEVRRCGECDRIIASCEWFVHVHQHEHEQCQICEEDYCDGKFISDDPSDYDDDEEFAAAKAELAAHKHSYGEQFQMSVCRQCSLLLAAIWDLEEIEGCPEHARQPAYRELEQTIYEDLKWEGGKYAKHAVELFPELSTHRFITAE